jgi:hypothetical protein
VTSRSRSTEGAVFVETLIAVLVPIYFFFSTWQLTDLLTAQLIVKHAAVVAARAAIVVGPDDPRFYGGQGENQFSGVRLDDVKSAAAMVLAASPHFSRGGFSVAIDGTFGRDGALTATVRADYPCFSPWLNMVCGGGAYRTLTGKGVLPYQYAPFAYSPL